MDAGSQHPAPLLIDRAAGVATLRLNRPERLNAFNRQLTGELREVLAGLARDSEVRAVLITGAGRAFSSGADLMELAEEGDSDQRPDLRTALEERFHPILRAITTMGKPVIAAVNGPAVGIGCSIALACDLVLCAESAYFSLAFVNIGLVPDGGASLLVPARAGTARFRQMAMLGEPVAAEQALQWALADAVHADDELQEQAQRLAGRLAAGPTLAYAGIKRQVAALGGARLDQQLALEAEIQQEMSESADAREGAMAFLQKRAPNFRGS